MGERRNDKVKARLFTAVMVTLFLGSILGVALVPATMAQSGGGPFETDLIADGGSAATAVDVGDVLVWNDEDYLYVKYVTTDDWWITEVHLQVAASVEEIPQSKGNPVPGKFTYGEQGLWTQEYEFDPIPLNLWSTGTTLWIAAHAKVMDISCYQTAILYGMERYTGKVYGIDVLTGTSWEIFDNVSPPPEGSATPNGLAYDGVNGRFYYTNYQSPSPNTLFFWDTATNTEYVAGTLIGQVACADIWNGKYYYIAGPPPSDDLYEVTFDANGFVVSNTKLGDIVNNEHGWTFDGDIAVKDNVVYGWGKCDGPVASGHGFEFFTYNVDTSAFTVTLYISWQQSLQLAFGSNGILYGHRSGGIGGFYVVGTTNGDLSSLILVMPTPSPVHLYTDCASGMICEPRTETAWGAGELFPGKNWATYFKYTVQGWKLVETVEVYAAQTTPTSSTNPLAEGKQYKIVASGTAYAGGKYAEDIEFDAEYSYTWSDDPTDWMDGVAHYEAYGPNLLDLKVEDQFINWGPFNTAHVYEYTMTGTGTTLALELLIYDIYYPNNSGYLTVTIYEWVP